MAMNAGKPIEKLLGETNPNNYKATKENGKWWGTIVCAGLTIIGFGALVVNSWIDFVHKPIPTNHGGRDRGPGRERH